MRTLSVLLLTCLICPSAKSQVTLVREAPNDSFDLSCRKCTTLVTDIAITRGQHAIPMNMKKPVAVNLLMWKYYDDILKKETLMAREPFWTKGTLLLDEVADTEMVSLHINLVWTDSTGLEHRFYLVAAGLRKAQLARLPLVTVYDPDTYAPLRFAAIAQISDATTEGEWSTYDTIDGMCTLNRFDPKTGSMSGNFEFTGNRVGMEQLGFFVKGTFEK